MGERYQIGHLGRILAEIFPPRASDEEVNPEEPFRAYEAAIQAIERIEDDSVPELLQESRNAFKRESERQQSSEVRAGTVISAAGIVGTLLVAAGSFVRSENESWVRWPVLFLYALSLFFLANAAVAALSVQRSKTRWTLGPNDIVPLHPENSTQLQRRLCQRLLEFTSNNYRVNNRQMLTLDRAQTLFRNAVIAAIVAGLLTPFLVSTNGGQELRPRSPAPSSPDVSPSAPAYRRQAVSNTGIPGDKVWVHLRSWGRVS